LLGDLPLNLPFPLANCDLSGWLDRPHAGQHLRAPEVDRPPATQRLRVADQYDLLVGPKPLEDLLGLYESAGNVLAAI
jgi:hypothetical protein